MLKHHIKTAIRNLQRNKIYSIINALGLALGLACVILIALWVQDEIRHDRFHTNRSRLYRVMANTHWGEVSTTSSVPAPLDKALKEDIPGVQLTTTMAERSVLVTSGNTSFKEDAIYASGDMLKMFSFPFLKGDINTALLSPNNLVITEALARKYFGNSDPIGKTIKINSTDIFQVAGVLKNIPTNSSLKFGLLLPFEIYEKKNPWLKGWGNFSVSMYVMIKPHVSIQTVNTRVKHILKKKNGADNKDEIILHPFSDMYLYSDFKEGKQVGGRIEYVRLFSIIAFFILVIACINFMNLATARSVKRAKEVGIRKVIGAERKLIIVQFMGEALLLTLLSTILALVIAWLLLPYFNNLTGKEVVINLLEPSFLAVIAATVTFTALLSGSYPALFLSSFKPATIFKVKRAGNALLRKVLVVLQFALSVILISGTLMIYKQIHYIKNKNLGIDKENLLVLPAEGDIYNHLEDFQYQLSQLAAVKSVTVTGNNPLDIQAESSDLNWPGKIAGTSDRISATWVGFDYLKTIGAPLLMGRDFEKGKDDTVNYIINETAARMMSLKDPIGQTVEFWNGKGQIIGVVKDFHLKSLHEPISPLILVLDPRNSSYILVKTQKGKTQQAIRDIEEVYNKYNSAFPFEYHFLDTLYEQRYKSEMMIGALSNAFAILTIFISCLGLFGLAAFTAEQRIREIGIRKVLGATVSNITSLLSKDFLKLVLLAIVIAIPVALWASNKWLQNFAYHTELPLGLFALSGIMAVLITFLTVSFQAVKAAVANPVKSLRTE